MGTYPEVSGCCDPQKRLLHDLEIAEKIGSQGCKERMQVYPAGCRSSTFKCYVMF